MRRRISMVAAGAALLMLAPAGLGGERVQAMTCAAQPPIDTACDVGFGVLYTVCTGQLTLPKLPVATAAAVGWPIECPPLG